MPKIKKKMLNECRADDCNRKPRYGFDDEIVNSCREHREEGMLDQYNARCQSEGCIKQASFGTEHKKPLFCNSHKETDMVNVWNKMCDEDGCKTTPKFGYEDKKPIKCAAHKLEDMRDVSHKICEEEGCIIRASYGIIDQKPKYCSKHGKSILDMHNVVTDKCHFENCQIRPSFGVPGKAAEFCKAHKSDEMSFLGRKCLYIDCSKKPCFGWPGGRPSFCTGHKLDGMVDVLNKMCEIEDCPITANYGYEKSKPLFCKVHGMSQSPQAKLVTGKKCESLQCEIIACFGFAGQHAQYCVTHKSEDMINVKEVREACSNCALNFNIQGLNNDGLCCYCRPDGYGTHVKELKIKQVLEKTFPDLTFLHNTADNKYLKSARLVYRPDFWIEQEHRILVVEVDEHGHSSYDKDCEIVRMINICLACPNHQVDFIRFNPDGKGHEKEKVLVSAIEKRLNSHYSQGSRLSVEYLFYPDIRVIEQKDRLNTLLIGHLKDFI